MLYFIISVLNIIFLTHTLNINLIEWVSHNLKMINSFFINSEIATETFNKFFPSIFLCDLHFRSGSVVNSLTNSYQLQCIYPLNIYIEKIYSLLLLWLIFISFLNIICIPIFLYKICLMKIKISKILKLDI